jgi:hypothetical protein
MFRKNCFLFGVFLFLLVGSLGNVFALESQTFGEECLDYLDSFDSNFSLLQGINVLAEEGIIEVSFISKSSLKGGPFSNILSYDEAEHLSFIGINESNGEILFSDFSINESREYLFGNNLFFAPAGSRIIFDGNKINLKVVEGAKFDFLPSLLDSNLFGNDFEIEGKNIEVSDDLFIREGRIILKDNGYLIEEGEVEYKNNLINVLEGNDVLIADELLEGYSGNWIFQDKDILKIKSSEGGEINLDVLEGHEILNTDKYDKLNFFVTDGDGIEIADRKNEGLIPSVFYEGNGAGNSIIKNDGLETSFSGGEYLVDIGKMPSTKADFENPYQSVAMEIESDLMENEKLVINSYRQFNVVSQDNQELVTFNKYDLPVSTRIEDNSLQTIEQMREKYPEVEFEFHETKATFGEENIPPYLLYVTDEFLKENPDAKEDIDRFDFSNIDNAYVSEIGKGKKDAQIVGIGSSFVEASTLNAREVTSPKKILEHEYEHVLDNIIFEEELSLIKSLEGDLELKNSIEEYFKYKDNLVNLSEKLKKINLKIADPTVEKYPVDYRTKEDLESNLFVANTWLENYRLAVKEEYYRVYPDNLLLQQCYNKIVVGGKKEFIENEETMTLLDEVLLEINQKFQVEFQNIVEKYPEIKLEDLEKDRGVEIHEDISLAFSSLLVNSDVLEKKDLLKIQRLAGIVEYANKRDFDGIEVSEEEFFNSLLPSLSRGLGHITKTNNDPSYTKFIRDLEKIKFAITGIPYDYSFYNYGSDQTIANAEYKELSTTFRELDEPRIIQNINSQVPQVSKTTKELVQIAFDSGKMDVEKYKRLMGAGHCQKPDCCDKKCLIYKFLCEGAC